MSTLMSNPSINTRISCNLSSGAAPAVTSTAVAQSAAGNPPVGTSAGSVNRCISLSTTVTNGTPLTVDVLTAADPNGNTAGIAHVTHVMVTNLSTTSGQDLTIGGGTHPVLGSDQYTAQANGGSVLVQNPNPGYAAVSSSSDTLTITVAAGTAVPLQITIFGRST